MIPETFVEMKKRHWKEEEQLRNNCPHQMKNLIKKIDYSCIGRGTRFPRRDIICNWSRTRPYKKQTYLISRYNAESDGRIIAGG